MKLTKEKILHLGILSAMKEEVGNIESYLNNIKECNYGDLKVISGEFKVEGSYDKKLLITLAWSGWGKVSSARAATRIIGSSYKGHAVDALIFTGVAGSLDNLVKKWDVIIPQKVIQYDLDPRPIFKRFQIPSLQKDLLFSDEKWHTWIANVIRKNIKRAELSKFKNIHFGLIGTADKFLSSTNEIEKIKQVLPELQAVEMEGASFAQVADQEGIPWIIVRVISDSADESASEDFSEFIKKYTYSSIKLIKCILDNFQSSPKFESNN